MLVCVPTERDHSSPTRGRVPPVEVREIASRFSVWCLQPFIKDACSLRRRTVARLLAAVRRRIAGGLPATSDACALTNAVARQGRGRQALSSLAHGRNGQSRPGWPRGRSVRQNSQVAPVRAQRLVSRCPRGRWLGRLARANVSPPDARVRARQMSNIGRPLRLWVTIYPLPRCRQQYGGQHE
jgi:hypothetical protein